MTSAFQPKFTITNRMPQAITRIERARGFLEAAQLSADWVREVGEKAFTELGAKSHFAPSLLKAGPGKPCAGN